MADCYRIAVYTQVHENYGTHACDCGSDEACTCRPYWKAKGGDEYIREIGDLTAVTALGSAGLLKLSQEIGAEHARDDRFYQEYAIDWEVLAPGEESWHEKDEREYTELMAAV